MLQSEEQAQSWFTARKYAKAKLTELFCFKKISSWKLNNTAMFWVQLWCRWAKNDCKTFTITYWR